MAVTFWDADVCTKQTQNILTLVLDQKKRAFTKVKEHDGHNQRAQNIWERENSATTGRLHVRNEKDCTTGALHF